MAQGNARHGGSQSRRPRVLQEGGSGPTSAPGDTDSKAGRAQTSSAKTLAITFAAGLRAHRGKLEHGEGPGELVHAASFLNQRRIVLDEVLLDHAPNLIAIFTHEVFHFVWRRLPNPERAAWSELLASEIAPRHPGLSSRLRHAEYLARPNARNWRNYICEAFCDSSAALGASNNQISKSRRDWLQSLVRRRKLPV